MRISDCSSDVCSSDLYLIVGGGLQVDGDPGELALDRGDHRRQHIAGLGVGGGQRQLPGVLAALVGRIAADVAGFVDDAPRVREDALAGGRDAFEAAALAPEQLETQFVSDLLTLLGPPGLGGVSAPGTKRAVQAASGVG